MLHKDSNRVLRGGSWNNNAQNCRSANRNNNTPTNRNNNYGFRIVSLQLKEWLDGTPEQRHNLSFHTKGEANLSDNSFSKHS